METTIKETRGDMGERQTLTRTTNDVQIAFVNGLKAVDEIKEKKPLLERLKKVHYQIMMPNEMQTMFSVKERIELEKRTMYEKIIKELVKEGLIEEEIEDTPDNKVIKMCLTVLEPEKDI